jgi:hypothetical protein
MDVRFEEGGDERAEKIARKMKGQGYSPDKIHDATDIPIETIEKL